MHPWRPWIAIAVLATSAGQAAVIYKWTDANGVVHYSDQPVPGAEKIFTSSPNLSAGGAASATARGQPGSDATKPTGGVNYSQFAIISPTPDQSFFGDEAINVRLALEPSLKANQSITWHLNGKPVDDQGPTATQFTLQHLDRGTYAISATITDQQTGESQSTDSVNFFVRQPSSLSPQHQRP
jgi:hypothetical protein